MVRPSPSAVPPRTAWDWKWSREAVVEICCRESSSMANAERSAMLCARRTLGSSPATQIAANAKNDELVFVASMGMHPVRRVPNGRRHCPIRLA